MHWAYLLNTIIAIEVYSKLVNIKILTNDIQLNSPNTVTMSSENLVWVKYIIEHIRSHYLANIAK